MACSLPYPPLLSPEGEAPLAVLRALYPVGRRHLIPVRRSGGEGREHVGPVCATPRLRAIHALQFRQRSFVRGEQRMSTATGQEMLQAPSCQRQVQLETA